MGENHGFGCLQAAGLKLAVGKAVRHCHSWVGAGCPGYPGRCLPKVTEPLGARLPLGALLTPYPPSWSFFPCADGLVPGPGRSPCCRRGGGQVKKVSWSRRDLWGLKNG